MAKPMRKEMKIALLLFALNTTVAYLAPTPEFIRGFLFGLSLLFMVFGLIPEKNYIYLKNRQKRKLTFIKELLR